MKGTKMGMHASNRVNRHLGQRILATLAIVAAVCGGLITGSAIASEPAKCSTGVDKVCYAGYNAAGLKQIADDLSDKGKGSSYYAEMEDNLNKGTQGSLTLSDGSNLPFKLIGILHDDKADGSGKKAGLTFMAWNSLPKAYCMNGTMPNDNTTTCASDGYTNKGGWRDSNLRQWMNTGEIWNQFPTDFQNNVTTVLKQTNNMYYGNTSGSAASATADKVWLVSYRELVPIIYDGWKSYNGFPALSQEGSQYEYFQGKVMHNYSNNNILSGIYETVSGSAPSGGYGYWWERSPDPGGYYYFLLVGSGGDPSYDYGARCRYSVVPAFSF